ncbi:MAG: aldehyde dehydrogenase family protein, partial [Syntrophomonas sp.]|nr:aldehyde dehydrogenase family protein [Syntrophomonas sp.]
LSLYLFSRDRTVVRWVVDNIPFGGGCVNDIQYQFANPWLPFGGRGGSGMGNYHGRFGFDAFSHQKAVLSKGFWFDLPIYRPYKDKHTYWKKLLR